MSSSSPDALTPPEVIALLLKMGERKHRQPIVVSFFKAWLAGFMLCFGAMLVQVVNAGSPGLHASNPALVSLIAAAIFPVGLIMLVITGQELITANFMIIAMTTLKRRTPVWGLPLNWTVVFFGNLAGALSFVAFLAHYSGLYDAQSMKAYAASVSVTKTSLSFGQVVLRGIGCNFLVCTAIWLGLSARETVSKVLGLHLPIFTFVLLGFEHVVVNMFYVPIGILSGADVSVGRYIARSMVPSFIGNVLGALILGATIFFYDPPAATLLPFFRGSSLPAARPHEDDGDSSRRTTLTLEQPTRRTHASSARDSVMTEGLSEKDQ